MLLQAFLKEVGDARDVEALRSSLTGKLEHARRQFPSIVFDEARAGTSFGRALRAGGDVDALSSELLVAAEALAGSAPALAVIDALIVSEAKQAAKALRAGDGFAEELAQQVRVKLFSPPAPKLADYGGRGSLKKWLRAAATRLGLNQLSADGRHRTEEDDDEEALGRIEGGAASPERALANAETAKLFSQALKAAFGALSPKERNLLRLYFLDGVSSEQLAKTYGTHRVTITRWLAAARETVVKDAVNRLAGMGVLSGASVGDVPALVRSHLGASWTDALGDGGP